MKNTKILLCLIALILINNYILADNTPREVISLNEGWGYKPITATKKDAALTSVTLPHTWNANYLEGTTTYNREMMIYQRNLAITPAMKDKRLFLYFEGVIRLLIYLSIVELLGSIWVVIQPFVWK